NTSFDVSTAPDAMQFVRWVQMDAPQIESVVQEDSLLRVGFDGRAALVRLGSITDRTGLREVWLRDSYGLGRVAGRLGTVVDLGGNIGMFTLRAAGLASRVITVEPVPDNVAMIRRNLELAGDAGHVQIVPHACGGEDEGELTLWVAPNAHGVNSVHRPHTERYAAAEALKCRSVSLRRLFDE